MTAPSYELVLQDIARLTLSGHTCDATAMALSALGWEFQSCWHLYCPNRAVGSERAFRDAGWMIGEVVLCPDHAPLDT